MTSLPGSSLRRLSRARAETRAIERMVECLKSNDQYQEDLVLTASPSDVHTERFGKTPRYWSVGVRVANQDGPSMFLVDLVSGSVTLELMGL